jgi:hypothetical protein
MLFVIYATACIYKHILIALPLSFCALLISNSIPRPKLSQGQSRIRKYFKYLFLGGVVLLLVFSMSDFPPAITMLLEIMGITFLLPLAGFGFYMDWQLFKISGALSNPSDMSGASRYFATQLVENDQESTESRPTVK